MDIEVTVFHIIFAVRQNRSHYEYEQDKYLVKIFESEEFCFFGNLF